MYLYILKYACPYDPRICQPHTTHKVSMIMGKGLDLAVWLLLMFNCSHTTKSRPFSLSAQLPATFIPTLRARRNLALIIRQSET